VSEYQRQPEQNAGTENGRFVFVELKDGFGKDVLERSGCFEVYRTIYFSHD
jgi:hypothetical protein